MARSRENLEATIAGYAADMRRLEAIERSSSPEPYDSWEEIAELHSMYARWLDEDENELFERFEMQEVI